jgi:hypothetical protein
MFFVFNFPGPFPVYSVETAGKNRMNAYRTAPRAHLFRVFSAVRFQNRYQSLEPLMIKSRASCATAMAVAAT